MLRSGNLRGSHRAIEEIGSREGEVDIYCFQEVAVGEGDKFYGLEGYEVIGGFIKREKGSVVSMVIHKRWKGRYKVLDRCQWKIGVRLELGKGKIVDVWNVYIGEGKHGGCLERMEGGGNVV